MDSSSPGAIALTGRKAPIAQYRNAYQEIAHAPLFAPVTRYAASIASVEQLPFILPQAFREATAETPRPVYLEVAGLMGEFLERAEAHRDKPALVDATSGSTLTHGDLVDGVRRVAATLARRGFGKGYVLSLYLPNLPEYAIALHAVASLGGIVHPANPMLTPKELCFQLSDSRASGRVPSSSKPAQQRS